MSGCIRYCVSRSVYHSRSPGAPTANFSPFAMFSKRCISDTSCPARRATSDAIVAGNCAGSPTNKHRLGRLANAMSTSDSSACAASSTMRASGGGMLAMMPCPELARVANTSVARDTASLAYSSDLSPRPEPVRSISHAFRTAASLASALTIVHVANARLNSECSEGRFWSGADARKEGAVRSSSFMHRSRRTRRSEQLGPVSAGPARWDARSRRSANTPVLR